MQQLKELPSPSVGEQASPGFNEIFDVIKSWDICPRDYYDGYYESGNGSHVKLILDGLAKNGILLTKDPNFKAPVVAPPPVVAGVSGDVVTNIVTPPTPPVEVITDEANPVINSPMDQANPNPTVQ